MCVTKTHEFFIFYRCISLRKGIDCVHALNIIINYSLLALSKLTKKKEAVAEHLEYKLNLEHNAKCSEGKLERRRKLIKMHTRLVDDQHTEELRRMACN